MLLSPARLRCPTCGADWSARGPRFCGRCGAPLADEHATHRRTARGDAPHRRTARDGRPPQARTARAGGPGPRRVGLVLAVGAIALAAGVLLRDGGVRPSGPATSPPEQAVSLPPPVSLPGVDGAPAGARDPEPATALDCEPVGCAAWRVTLDGPGTGPIAVTDTLVVAVEPRSVQALDASTGEPRWRTGLADLLQLASDGTPVAELTGAMPVSITADERAVLVTTPTRAALLDATTGAVAWIARSSWWELRGGALLDEVAVVTGGSGRRAGSNPRVVALNRRDGSVRWDRVLREPLHLAPEAIVAATDDGAVAGLDPSDGRVRWRAPLPAGSWPVLEGPWLVVEIADGHVLLDPASGQRLARLDGYLTHAVHDAGPTLISVLTPPGRGVAGRDPRAIVGLDPDGTERWRLELSRDDDHRCCTVFAPWHDGVLLGDAAGGIGRVLDPADGRVLRERVPLPIAGGWVTRSGLFARWEGRRLLLSADRGPVVEVAGTDLDLLSDAPLVVRGGAHLLGLRVPPDGG